MLPVGCVAGVLGVGQIHSSEVGGEMRVFDCGGQKEKTEKIYIKKY